MAVKNESESSQNEWKACAHARNIAEQMKDEILHSMLESTG